MIAEHTEIREEDNYDYQNNTQNGIYGRGSPSKTYSKRGRKYTTR